MSTVHRAGYDGSAAAHNAVAFAARLAGALGAELTAVSAHPALPPALAPGASAMADAELEHELKADTLKLLEGLEDVPGIAHRRAVAGAPARALVELAEHEGASLITVATTHRGRVGRLAGSVAERLLHGAPCAVLVVPPEVLADAPVRTVGVAFDDSPEAHAALDEAATIARGLGAELLVLAVAEPVFTGTAWNLPKAYDAMDPDTREQFNARMAEAAAEHGGRATTLRGEAGPALIEASKGTVDLLVCGSRSYGPLRAVLAGSVSRHLADHAHCPVLVMPRGAHVHVDQAAAAAAAEA
ncbi:MAG: universal stress protein [Solirubrobacterales bacterium]|nr:universal stress protein [Solirubrobacterales bacterium]